MLNESLLHPLLRRYSVDEVIVHAINIIHSRIYYPFNIDDDDDDNDDDNDDDDDDDTIQKPCYQDSIGQRYEACNQKETHSSCDYLDHIPSSSSISIK